MAIFGSDTTIPAELVLPGAYALLDSDCTPSSYGIAVGNQDTAVGIIAGNLDDLTSYFAAVVEQLTAEQTRLARYTLTAGTTRRGRYRLPKTSVQEGVDEDAMVISRNLGGTLRADRRTPGEVAAAYRDVFVATMVCGRCYLYLVAPPGISIRPPDEDDTDAECWRAFTTAEGLRAWAQAYGLGLPASITPGEEFLITMPPHTDTFEPVA